MQHIVIIGNGIAGITAARHIRKLGNDKISVISGETDHFFSRTALMYIFMGHMKYEHTKPYEDWFWKKNKIELIKGWVKTVNFEGKLLQFESGETLSYDKLIIATGSKSNKFGWPGEDLNGVQGLYSYQDLESMETNTKGISHAVVVGGGLIGIEMVEMLHSRHIPVTFLVREDSFWDMFLPPEESGMINNHIREYGIDLRLNTEVEEIINDGTGNVKAIKTKSAEIISCEFLGLTVGVSPNIDFLKDSKLEVDKGVLVDDYLKTNIDDVYAIGDCAQIKNPMSHRKPIEAVWYTGRMMGETLAQTIAGKDTKYQPGIWFNSAKFFDIEYQVYGEIEPIPSKDVDSIYWEAPNGKNGIRIAFDKSKNTLKGMNAMGIRFRHNVWNDWIASGARIKDVVANLQTSFFDPEFSIPVDREIQKIFNQKFPDDQITAKKKSFLEKILSL
ncbi:MAG: NAD(P)/FAD-dependent oxidoreductase [Bacteroidota bacterium]